MDYQPASFNNNSRRTSSYNRWRRGFFVIGIIWSIASSALFITSGLTSKIERKIQDRLGRETPAEFGTLGAYLLLSWLGSLPLAYLRGFTLEHRFELSNQTRVTWLGDHLKGLALQLALLLPISRLVLGIIRRRPGDWWLVLSTLAVPFTVVMAQLAPVLILPLFNTYRPLRNEGLAHRLKQIAARSGIDVAEVLEMDMSRQTRKANAFFTGIGRTKRIVLADTLLESLEEDEIETIVAHEIAHQAHGDIWRLIAVGTLATAAIAFITQRLSERALDLRVIQRSEVRTLTSTSSLPLIGLIGSIVALVVSPLQNAYSRRRERRADDFALQLTDNPVAFASALIRVAELNLSEVNPPRIEQILLHSHPSIKERVDRCQVYRQR